MRYNCRNSTTYRGFSALHGDIVLSPIKCPTKHPKRNKRHRAGFKNIAVIFQGEISSRLFDTPVKSIIWKSDFFQLLRDRSGQLDRNLINFRSPPFSRAFRVHPSSSSHLRNVTSRLSPGFAVSVDPRIFPRDRTKRVENEKVLLPAVTFPLWNDETFSF